MLDVRRLEILAEVRDRGSFSAAARALHLSPSAVSQQIAALEREVALVLVSRSPGSVGSLTGAGEILAGHAEDILRRIRLAESEMGALAADVPGRIRLASFASAAATLVPPAVTRFRARWPSVELVVQVADPAAAIDLLRSGDAELALITEVPGEGPEFDGVETVPVFSDEFAVLVPAGHPLQGRGQVTLGELRREQWIMGSETGVCPDARVFRRACTRAGFVPRVAFRSEDYPAVQGLVAAGVGLSLIPALAVAGLRDDVVALPIAGDAPFRQVVTARLRGPGRTAREVTGFADALRDAAAGYAPVRPQHAPAV
ncbi:LysR substrate-binding domain-containing protein [Pseudonocardia sp. NPDC046786]|uniref:LysR family transcriptional regulator n=1 Tax=Pseudonocardia sp. NPDC046786 TaxID=3155471 RepID=UPI0033E90BFC